MGRFWTLMLGALIGMAAAGYAQPRDTLQDELGRPIALRGIALDNWLTGGVAHEDSDTRAIAAMGGNCIKIEIPFTLLSRADPVVREQRLAQIERMAGYAGGAGLGVVLSCTEPAGIALFATDRDVRVAFVSTWIELIDRLASGLAAPTLRAIVPLEDPSAALSDPQQYSDLCSYLAQEIQAARPGLAMFLVPLEGPGPNGTPILTQPTVGGVCRIPVEAAALERLAIVRAAREWSREAGRAVLIDQVAPPAPRPREEWPDVLLPCLSAITHSDPPIHLIYDRMRSAETDQPGIALRYPSGGSIHMEPLLEGLLTQAFRGSLAPLPEPAEEGSTEPEEPQAAEPTDEEPPPPPAEEG